MNTLLGQRIREQRKEKGWTIEQFAERVELSANYVGDLERGVKIPKLETFIRIVEVLGVSGRCAYSGFRSIRIPCGR